MSPTSVQKVEQEVTTHLKQAVPKVDQKVATELGGRAEGCDADEARVAEVREERLQAMLKSVLGREYCSDWG